MCKRNDDRETTASSFDTQRTYDPFEESASDTEDVFDERNDENYYCRIRRMMQQYPDIDPEKRCCVRKLIEK